jgi:hypothetical protein
MRKLHKLIPAVALACAAAQPVSGSVGLAGISAVPESSACGFAILSGTSLLTRRRRRE